MRTYKDSKSGRYYIDYFFKGKRIRYPAGDTKKEADQLKSRITLDINADTHDAELTKMAVRGKAGGSLDFKTAVESFVKKYRPRGGTIRYYEQRSKIWLESFEGRPIGDITNIDVQAFLGKRLQDVSASTARKDLVSLATFFKWARKRGILRINPADAESVTRPADPFNPQETHWLSDDELLRLKNAAEPWLAAVIAWATETGMDKGKIRRLRWSELKLERVAGKVSRGLFAMQRDKTGKPVRQILSDGAIEALNRAAKTRHASGIVFLDLVGHPIDEKVLDWALGKVYTAVGIKGCNFRTFRHTFATRALRRGVPKEVLARMMGHSTAFITERYMHVADDQLQAAAEALSGPERLHGSNVAVGVRQKENSEATKSADNSSQSVA